MARWHGDLIRTALARVAEVEIDLVGGELTVTSTEGPTKVDVEVLAGPPAAVTLENGVLCIRHGHPGAMTPSLANQPGPSLRGRRSASWVEAAGRVMAGRQAAAVTVAVPASTPATISAVSADLTVAGLGRGVRVSGVSAAIVLESIAGGLRVRTVSGEVEAQHIEGDVEVSTVSGDVTIDGRTARLEARSVSGDLSFDVEGLRSASLTTVSGHVAVRLPGAAHGRLELRTASGEIDSAFELVGVADRRRVRASFGDTQAGVRHDLARLGDEPSVRDDAGRTDAAVASDLPPSTISGKTVSGDIAILRVDRETAAAFSGTSGAGWSGLGA